MTASFKSLTASGVFKRVDGLRVRLLDLKVETGFNLREEGPELREHIENITAAIKAGEPIAPIEVRVSDAGDVLVVDGHCRREAYLQAVADGAPIEWLDVVRFTGNDVDRVARIITSQEGRKLTPLEMAKGYKRLAGMGLDSEAIAARFRKTRQHVDQLLILANANNDVHKMVAAGSVSAATAVDLVRKHGEGAGAVIADSLDRAQGLGKKKVTASTVNPWAPPKKLATSLVDELDALVGELDQETRVELAKAEARAAAGEVIPALEVRVPLAAMLSLMAEHAKVSEARDKHAEKMRGKGAQQEIPQEGA